MPETKTWYKIDRWSAKITAVQVVKETPAYITVLAKYWTMNNVDKTYERRCAKREGYFPTFAEARIQLMQYFKCNAEGHKLQWEAANSKWTKLFMQEVPDAEK